MYKKRFRLQYMTIIIMVRMTEIIECDNKNIRNNIDLNDITSLSELPIEKLLLLRQTLKQETPIGRFDPDNKTFKSRPQNAYRTGDEDQNVEATKTEDQTATAWAFDRHSYHDGAHHESENMLWLKTKGNIQAIFQTTVTVLAFLAFGGYLVCLILTTFKGGPQGAVVVQTTTSTTTDNRVVKRHVHDFGFKRPTNITDHDSEMYALCQIADGYTKYHILTSAKNDFNGGNFEKKSK